MARLEGKQSAVWFYTLGVIVLAAAGAGAYYYQINTAQGVAPSSEIAPNPTIKTQATSASNPALDSTSDSEPETNVGTPNSTPVSAITPDSNSSITPTEVTPTAVAETSAEVTVPTVSATASSVPNPNPMIDAATPAPATGPAGESTSSAEPNKASTSNTSIGSGRNEVVSKRSKTISNSKTGTTVTYSKEVLRDGSIVRSKSTGATPVNE